MSSIVISPDSDWVSGVDARFGTDAKRLLPVQARHWESPVGPHTSIAERIVEKSAVLSQSQNSRILQLPLQSKPVLAKPYALKRREGNLEVGHHSLKSPLRWSVSITSPPSS